MELFTVNWWAVLVSSGLVFFFGAIWYSPFGLFQFWHKVAGLTASDMEKMPVRPWLFLALGNLALSFSLSVLVKSLGEVPWYQALGLSALLWFGLAFAAGFANSSWGRRPFLLHLIDETYNLLGIIVMTSVHYWWR